MEHDDDCNCPDCRYRRDDETDDDDDDDEDA